MYLFIGSIETHRISVFFIASTVYATIFVCARTVALEVVDKPRMATFRRLQQRIEKSNREEKLWVTITGYTVCVRICVVIYIYMYIYVFIISWRYSEELMMSIWCGQSIISWKYWQIKNLTTQMWMVRGSDGQKKGGKPTTLRLRWSGFS